MSFNDLPSFDEFLSSLGPDYMDRWLDPAALPRITALPASPDGLSRFASDFLGVEIGVTMAILRDYHQWLSQQLSSRSLRLV